MKFRDVFGVFTMVLLHLSPLVFVWLNLDRMPNPLPGLLVCYICIFAYDWWAFKPAKVG